MFGAALRHHQAGRLNEAERLYRQVLQADPRHADALHFLGVLAHQAGRHDAAVDLIARALSQQPDNVAAHYNLGVALHSLGKLDEAVASYGRALVRKPDHAEAHGNLANALQAQGKLDEAVASYGRALRSKPDYADAHSNLGNVQKAQGKLDLALASYTRALMHKPDHAEAHCNLGNLLMEQGRLDEAAASYERALAQKPDYAAAHLGLGHVRKEQGRLDEAAACYGRALAVKPDYAEARLGLAIAVIPIFAESMTESIGAAGKFGQSLDDLTAWNRANPGRLGASVGSSQPFYLAYRPVDVRATLSRYGDLAYAAAKAHWSQGTDECRAIQAPRGRIRLGIVSGQVRRHHPVWEVVLRGLIAHVDRRRFEIFLYHTGSIADEETLWAKSRVDRFLQGPKSTKGWLDEVRQDRPDVMFYPEVGMDPATCALAALRLAPLQIAGWGHPVTTGLPSMDLFLSGELLEGVHAEQHYREKLVRLPGTGVCTELTPVQSQHWGGPDRRLNAIRFTLCHQPIKFDPADDVLLTRIAKAVGPSEFWLASPTKLNWATHKLRDRLAAAFRAQGLDPDAHLRVLPWLSRNQFAGYLDEMDVYLDCPAFSGYTTAWQAIHRGIPIVTLEGEYLRQRLAAGLLRQIGITDEIASSRDRYVEIAVRAAQECRQSDRKAARREAIARAAPRADGNRTAVSAFEETLIAAHSQE